MKRLGSTDAIVPEIGLGTWRYSGGVEPLRRGIELGAFLIDTAEGYNTEDIVGEAISGIPDRAFIATKVSGRHLSYDAVLRAAEDSLLRLGVDCIDLYQVHWPNPVYPISETMHAMEELADRGLVKFIGVSNFSIAELQEALALMRHHPIVSNQMLYNLKRREIEIELLPYCEEHGITVMAYTPLDDGSLAAGSRFLKGRGMKALERIASETGKTPAQVALNWCTASPNVIVIPKSNSTERTEENCEASGWRLSDAQIKILNDAFPL